MAGRDNGTGSSNGKSIVAASGRHPRPALVSGAELPHGVQLESLFWAMTGETEESFRQGRMVEAQVIYVGAAPGSSVRWEKTLQKP